MKYKVSFSSLANAKLVSVTTYLKEEWSLKSKQNFVALLREKVLHVSQYPESCVKSEKHFNLYKCIVTKQTSFLYTIKNKEIEVVTILDNRSSNKSIRKEIRKYYGRI